MILCIKNIEIEGPETIGRFFESKGFELQVIDLSQGETLPESLAGIDAVICLGGPMNVYEEEKYPYLKAEDVFIKDILAADVPYLGLCLGSQLLAKAAGANVIKSPTEEIGWFSVDITRQGEKDPLFTGLIGSLDVFQWHGDMFEIPENGKLLAASPGCPHQAFRVGANAYGLQFHVEITDKSIREWSERYFRDQPQKLEAQQAEMLRIYEACRAQFDKDAKKLYENFLKIILNQKEEAVT